MCIDLHVKSKLFLSDCNETIFLDRFSKNTQISNFMKIRPVVTESFYADRHNKVDSLFSQVCKHA
jgi:hypothetical protein